LLHVPYKGSANLMHPFWVATSWPQVAAGKLRVLNTWGAECLAKFPDAPTPWSLVWPSPPETPTASRY